MYKLLLNTRKRFGSQYTQPKGVGTKDQTLNGTVKLFVYYFITTLHSNIGLKVVTNRKKKIYILSHTLPVMGGGGGGPMTNTCGSYTRGSTQYTI